MSKKQRTPQKPPFPTFGECFKTVVQAFGLNQLAEAISPHSTDSFPYMKSGDNGSVPEDLLRAIASKNCLLEWASEENGPPKISYLQAYIAHSLKPFGKGTVDNKESEKSKQRVEDLNIIFQRMWFEILDCHRMALNERYVLHDKNTTRTWYAHAIARRALEWLILVQVQLKRIYKIGPIFEKPLQTLLSTVWTDESNPLTRECLDHFLGNDEKDRIDPKTLKGWMSGEHHSNYASLGVCFERNEKLEAIIFNFAFARLLENLSTILERFAPKKERLRFYKSLIHQAQSLNSFYEVESEDLSTIDYFNTLIRKCNERGYALTTFSELEDAAPIPDHLVSAVQYEKNYLSIDPPSGWYDFQKKFGLVFQASAPQLKTLLTITQDLDDELQHIRKAHPIIFKQFAGPVSCVQARLRLTDTKLNPQQRLKTAMRCYREAVEGSIYSSGNYTPFIVKEAIGFIAWVYRNTLQSGRGKSGDELKPLLAYCYNWLDLLGFSDDFKHPQEAQRYEKAEHYFLESLSSELRENLKSNLRGVEFYRIDFTSAISFIGFEAQQERQAVPVNKRQKKPFSKTVSGREQTPLMEAIDRRQMDYANELAESEENLNFINSTCDNAVTKALDAEDIELALKILRREKDPITPKTLLHSTEKLAENVLSMSISTGQIEILKELLAPSISGRDAIDPNSMACLGQTPLYFTVNILGFWKMDFEEMLCNAGAMMPPTKAMQGLMHHLNDMTERKLEIFKAAHDYYRKSANSDGVTACFKYLLTNEKVKVDQKNHNGHTAFTLAVQSRCLDLAEMLLESGADVNHRFDLGGTALCWANRNEDVDAVRLLLKHGARTDL